ncbi:riboflavin biosynthesis protein RibD [Owenweeksia hongkongensis DSM 17368]|uniref:Riboflavin biosynthesis protein RibD n=1 Tax=Owenweeksia hongkongensis (strain DSM 17368 / CIP 108786 / JCM 12287 / NRRL B-23963 / UST20020801) TaxID=926562 RepID=G8R3C5_OWEHD|nr:bifunctional diaminohydroxyphosphoribosylaminopyrimidine deaminase/5-amino-6-(5-phosphoribosylamino)uracil reductase RibD [Owenweeksia hongkongensis]AEV31946.1 riboflavin biosynthesis protein RibD [Owenweeksia hongkongensis DSM 17368]
MKHELYIQRCIQLAENAKGNTCPNPLVGSVIVHNDQIIGEGWHAKSGEPHAEVNAINSVQDKSVLTESTIYVSLEPCAHFGKTPPCADLIVKNKIPRVVIGCRDPFDAVNGKGIEKLQAAGIEVLVGVLEKECLELNSAFFTYHTKKRPYIILKWAQTQDGYLDKIREEKDNGVNWITQPETKLLVHRWRHEVDGILVGAKTIINDNPELTVRLVEGQNPMRLIIDPNNRIPKDAKIFSESGKTVVFSNELQASQENITYFELDSKKLVLESVLKACYDLQIQSILVEGGAHTLQSFIEANLWDEARVLTGASSFGQGLRAPSLTLNPTETHRFGKDSLRIFYR